MSTIHDKVRAALPGIEAADRFAALVQSADRYVASLGPRVPELDGAYGLIHAAAVDNDPEFGPAEMLDLYQKHLDDRRREEARTLLSDHLDALKRSNAAKTLEEEAWSAGADEALAVVGAEMRRIYDALQDVRGALGIVADANQAIDLGVTDEWNKLRILAREYVQLRDVHAKVLDASGEFSTAAEAKGYLIHDLSGWVRRWQTKTRVSVGTVPFDLEPSAVTVNARSGRTEFYSDDPVINERFMLWLSTLPFEAVEVVSPGEMGTRRFDDNGTLIPPLSTDDIRSALRGGK